LIEVITDNFFFGRYGLQYISGSNGNLVISSSGFYLGPDGVIISGSITASAGSIGGWNILADRLQSKNNNMMLSGSGVISSSNFYVGEDGNVTASDLLLTNGSIGGNGSTVNGWVVEEGILRDDDSTIVLDSENKYITLTDSAITIDSGTGIFLSASGELNFATSNGRIQIQDDDIKISGSDINILTPNFFLGSLDTAYISSSNSSIVISSSNFYVSEEGNLTASNAYFSGSIYVGGTITSSAIYTETGNVSG